MPVRNAPCHVPNAGIWHLWHCVETWSAAPRDNSGTIRQGNPWPVQAMLALTEITQWRMSELVARSVAEYTSIFGAAALLTFGSITPQTGESVHVANVWTVAGVQVCTLTVTLTLTITQALSLSLTLTHRVGLSVTCQAMACSSRDVSLQS